MMFIFIKNNINKMNRRILVKALITIITDKKPIQKTVTFVTNQDELLMVQIMDIIDMEPNRTYQIYNVIINDIELLNPCRGCREDLGNQEGHMEEPDGCLYQKEISSNSISDYEDASD